MSDLFHQCLTELPWLLADGATGTNLFAVGLQSGYPPELWNVQPQHQAKVYNLHRAFVDAGADIILTNSFGATRQRLKLHQAEHRTGEINVAAAQIARRAADAAGRRVVVAGAIGPTGDLFEPLGPMTLAEGTDVFSEQAAALKQGGVDVLWIETMFSMEELAAAIAAAVGTGLPYVCTLSFDTKGRTMMGVSPARLTGIMNEQIERPVAFGANCGTGPAELMAVMLSMKRAARPDDVLVAKSNCGIPQLIDGEIRYTGTPEAMADYVRLAMDTGVRVIGGCCGTTPEHLRAMRAAMNTHRPGEAPSLDLITARLGEVSAGAQKQLGRGAAHPGTI